MQRLTREEMISLVTAIMNGAGSEEELDNWLDLLYHNTHFDVSDLIFWPKSKLTPEQIVDEALQHSPILLPPASNNF